jgi:hypothetical protein
MVFAIGLLLGIVIAAGADGAYMLVVSKPAIPEAAWDTTKIVCVARTETGFFVRNDSGKDYRLADAHQFVLMQSTAAGLVTSDTTIRLPIFIPAGETAEIGVDGMPAGQLALFDLGRRCKVTLK